MTIYLEDINATTSKEVSPVEFKLLFSSAERIAINSSTDAVVKDFLSIINDPRLSVVNLGLKSTVDALTYMASIGLIAEDRIPEILRGEMV